MEVRPFNRERELYTASIVLFGAKNQCELLDVYYDEGIEFNEIPIQRDMERNPEERKP